MTSGARARTADPAALPELIAALGWFPIASLLLTEDGSALEVNEAWTDLSGLQAEASLRDGWLEAVKPLDRALLRARLREAAVVGRAGSADFELVHTARGRLSRWWWRPGPAGRLVLCVAGPGDDRPGESAHGRRPDEPDLPPPVAGADVAQLVHRLFGVGLVLESAIGVTEGRAQHWLEEAVDQLDSLIRDIRTVVFDGLSRRHPDDP